MNYSTPTYSEYGDALYAQGYIPIPIVKGKKYPAIKNWTQADTDEIDIARWIQQGKGDCGIGILTGNIVAIDIDVRDKKTADKLIKWCLQNIGKAPIRFGNKPKALLVYRTDKPLTKISSPMYTNNLKQNHQIEILGQGQQFVAHGIHPDTNKPYEWKGEVDLLKVKADELCLVNDKQLKLLFDEFKKYAKFNNWEQKVQNNKQPLQGEDVKLLPNSGEWMKSKCDITDEDLAIALSFINADDYSRWVSVGMALYHQYDGNSDGLDLWNTWSSKSDKYSNDCEKKWNSFKATGKHNTTTLGTVLHYAKEAGWKMESPSSSISGFSLIPYMEMLNNVGPIDWLIDGLIESDALGQLYGPPGSYKTFIALNIGLCIASGIDWYGHKVKQGPVIYINGEGFNGIARRTEAWRHHNNVEGDLPISFSNTSTILTDENAAEKVMQEIESFTKIYGHPQLIIIDTLARNAGGDENSTQDMSKFIHHLDKYLRVPFGSSILTIHHTGLSNDNRARGSSVIRAAMDFEYQVKKTSQTVELKCTKMKDAEHPHPLYLAKEPVMWGIDEEENSLVLIETDKIPEKKKRQKLGVRQQAAMDELERQIDKSEAGRVLLSQWKEALVDNQIIKNQQNVSNDFYKIKNNALDRELIIIEREWVKFNIPSGSDDETIS